MVRCGPPRQLPELCDAVTITTTAVGQIENLTLTDDDTGAGTSIDYAVGYLNFVYIPNSSVFIQTGGNKTNHGDNTWNHYLTTIVQPGMTIDAANGLQQTATHYINNYNPGQQICINDMALPIGGVFDICNTAAINCRDKNQNLIVNPWGPPHNAHDLGTAVDVATKVGQCLKPNIVNLNIFLQECKNHGASKAHSIPESNHAHCDWRSN